MSGRWNPSSGAGWTGLLSPEDGERIRAALHATGTVSLGAGIALAAQIFNLEEHWPGGALLWAAGAWTGFLLLRDWPQAALAAVLTPARLASERVAAIERSWEQGAFLPQLCSSPVGCATDGGQSSAPGRSVSPQPSSTEPVDPALPIRGRYVELRLEARLRGDAAMHGLAVALRAENGQLVAIPDPLARRPLGSSRVFIWSSSGETAVLDPPLAFF
jgi:hypothetical protein